jgi:multimeric flavodoxin WrbA
MSETKASTPGASGCRALGIVGSPRRGGNTEALVDEVLAAAEEAGALVEKVILSNLDIRPCLACDRCAETRVCVQEDDFAQLWKRMTGSAVWVLGTPVYWFGPTAQFKSFLDRWYGVRRDLFAGRRVVLVVPLEDDASVARHVVGMITDALAYVKADLVATLVAAGASGRGAVRGCVDVMEAARQAGREAVRSRVAGT